MHIIHQGSLFLSLACRSRIYSHFLFGKLFLIEQFISFEYLVCFCVCTIVFLLILVHSVRVVAFIAAAVVVIVECVLESMCRAYVSGHYSYTHLCLFGTFSIFYLPFFFSSFYFFFYLICSFCSSLYGSFFSLSHSFVDLFFFIPFAVQLNVIFLSFKIVEWIVDAIIIEIN